MKTTRLWLLVVVAVLSAVSAMAQKQTIQVKISSSTDDAEERGANATSNVGGIDITSSDLEFANDGATGDQYIGMRFTPVSIPKGSKILNAYIQFTVDEMDNLPGSIVLKVQDSDNPGTFTANNFDISGRPVLADSVLWTNIPNWTVAGAAGTDQQTPNIAALIQAIVNRSGWQSGNALSIIAYGTGERTAESFDGSATQAPNLVIEYIAPVTASFSVLGSNDDAEMNVSSGSMDLSSSDLEFTTDGSSLQIIGNRFGNVTIPAGSIILDAYAQFTVDEVNSSGDVDVVIAFEETDNAAVITATTNDLAYRTYTDSIIWNNLPGWNTIGDKTAAQRTPNVAALLQQIVDRQGWTSGNALLMAMVDPAVLSIPGYSGNASKRVAQTYDLSPTNAPSLVVTYIPALVYQKGSFPISKQASWKYNDKGVDLSATNWTSPAYDDSQWAYGNGILGYGDGNESTTLNFGGNTTAKYPTYYLRHIFDVADASIYDSLLFDLLYDDGIVVYVNGTEAFRKNMPGGTVNYSTLALTAIGGADETTYFRQSIANMLQNGTNVIAVELHQNAVSSSDLSFDAAVGFKLKPLPPASYPFVKASYWHYLDDGSDLDMIPWKSKTFNDDNWAQGKGPLGYGDPMNTTLSYGSDPNNKYVTYYFRRDITIDTTVLPDSIEIGLRRDDGALVYINGTEVLRSNMPSGTISDSTLAPLTTDGSAESTYYTINVPKKVFNQGLNTIAVEVHNRDVFSSDIGFDLYLNDAPEVNPPALGCSNGNEAHIACFTSIAPTSQTPNMLIPTGSHRFQLIFKQGEAYTKGSGNVPGNHDFTAFVPLNGSSEIGHLSVNHENSPGGVSILDLHYDQGTKLWVVDTTQAVNFSTPDLVRTIRNCSGGITPWGTVITAEESTGSTDANGDGYRDIGWLVEIDPITASVKEYGNGKQEKLWACSNISHENALILDDSVTLYTGEDGGSSAVYKFIADNKTDLSSGKLYVLKLDQPLSGGEPTGTGASWIQVPNTTQTERNTTQSLAISLGATNFNGVEDIEISPVDGKIYFTSKGHGRVYRFKDNGSGVTNFETFVGGTSYMLNTSQGVFNEPWGGGNDNLTFDNEGNLWVLQDGGRNYMWVVRPDHSQASPKVELFMSAPAGAEPTGLTFSPDYRFGFVSIQHPSASNTAQKDATLGNVTINVASTLVFSRIEHLGLQLPVAGFVSDKRVVVAGKTVNFTDTSTNNPTSRHWVFNGGVPAVSQKQNETVMYPGPGLYTVELYVENAVGSDELVSTQYVQVIQPAPVAQFTSDRTYVRKGETVAFADMSSNNPSSWSWTFAGGTPATSTEKYPVVTYNAVGVYNVTLTTTNAAGSSLPVTRSSYIVVETGVGMEENIDQNGINIYPNPTKGQLHVDLNTREGESIRIELYDLTGRKLADLLDVKAVGGEQTWDFDLNSILSASQTVMVRISVDESVTHRTVQFIK